MEQLSRPGGRIPNQVRTPWSVVLSVSWGSLRRRILRSLITMIGVILAIAFLTYMLVQDGIVSRLIELRNDSVNLMLQKAGVDIYGGGGADSMTILLIGLSLLTCLVGIVNAMLMAVTERIKEIGTLKCLGAEDVFIVKTYFVESSLQGVLGTTIGIVLGLLVAITVMTISYGKYVYADFPVLGVIRSAAVALMIGSVISVVASIAPAYWASKKQPVDAMRGEE